MRAILIQSGVLSWIEQQDPLCLPDHVLLEVIAAGVNRADLLQRLGMYPPPSGVTEVPGLECAGLVKGSSLVPAGRYMALVPGGAYAEKVAVPRGMLIPVPAGLSWEEAACLPEAVYTAYLNLIKLGGLRRGETVWITSGSSGVGSLAIQLAKAFGARVIATAGSPDKVARCLTLGAEYCVNHRSQHTIESVKEAAGDSGVDLILDMIGGEYLNDRLRVLNRGGRMILIGLLGGTKGRLDHSLVLGRNLSITGSTLRDRSIEEKIDLTKEIQAKVMPWILDGRLVPVLDSVFPIEEVSKAHDRMQKNEHFGKIVLRIR